MSTNPAEEPDLVLQAYKEACAEQLDEGLDKIQHCLKQLDHAAVWWRPTESMNSIANLMLHLSGNIRQWLIAGLSQLADERIRHEEFEDRSGQSAELLVANLSQTIEQAKLTIQRLTATELLRVRRVQQFDINGFQAIADSIGHFRGHVQEIIHMSRCLKGGDYLFRFIPDSP